MRIFSSMRGRRRISQVTTIGLFFLVPLLNIFRVDLVTGRFYLWGRAFPLGAVNQVGIPLLLIVIVDFVLTYIFVVLPSINLLAERGFCGWVCPQTLLSEIGELSGVAAWKHHIFPGKGGKLTKGLRLNVVFRVLLGAAMAIVMAYGFTAYLVAPGAIWASLTAFNLAFWIFWLAALGWAFNFFFLGHLFCNVCPFGNLYQMLWSMFSTMVARSIPALGSGLRVGFLPGKLEACHHCDACVKSCPMDVPIMEDKHTLTCISCGACVDACSYMLAPYGQVPILGFIPAFTPADGAGGKTPAVWPRVILASLGIMAAIGLTTLPLLVGKPVLLNVASISSRVVGHTSKANVYLNLQNFEARTIRVRVVLGGLPPGSQETVKPASFEVLSGGSKSFTVFVIIHKVMVGALQIKILNPDNGKVLVNTNVQI